MPSYWTCRNSVTLCRRRLLLVGYYYEDVFVFVFQLLTLTGFSSREGEGLPSRCITPSQYQYHWILQVPGNEKGLSSTQLNSTQLPPLLSPFWSDISVFYFFRGGDNSFPLICLNPTPLSILTARNSTHFTNSPEPFMGRQTIWGLETRPVSCAPTSHLHVHLPAPTFPINSALPCNSGRCDIQNLFYFIFYPSLRIQCGTVLYSSKPELRIAASSYIIWDSAALPW